MEEYIYLQQTSTNIEYSHTENGTYSTINNWPHSLLAKYVFFKSNQITISQSTTGANQTYGATGANIFFICSNDNITIGNTGTQTTVTIDGINDYLGFIQNGSYLTSISGVTGTFSNITIQNINMATANDSTLGVTGTIDNGGGGWLCQPFFGYTSSIYIPTSTIINCHSTAPVVNLNTNYILGSGGLVGNNSCLSAKSCSFNSNILVAGSGGIFGGYSYCCFAENCVSGAPGQELNISENSGGIFGSNSIGCTASNCQNYIKLVGEFKGGIFGSYAGRVTDHVYNSCYAIECYNYGDIEGFGYGVGGIYSSGSSHSVASSCGNYGSINVNGESPCSGGIFAGYVTGSTAENCFNVGGISGTDPEKLGGIFGGNTVDCTTLKCYNISDVYGGGIFGGNARNCTSSRCYNVGDVYGGGGIFGSGCTGSIASFCYNSGNLNFNTGGIFGSTGFQCISNNCYSVGESEINSGAIFSFSAIDCNASHCYSINSVNIFGPDSQNSSSSTSMVSNGPWSDIEASTVLSNLNFEWVSVYVNTPFLLSSFNTNFYNNVYFTSINQNSYTTLTLSGKYGDYFFLFPDSIPVTVGNSSYLNLGQFYSSIVGNYEFSVITTNFYNQTNTVLQNTSSMYGYNIISVFLLYVNQVNPLPNTLGSTNGYDILKHFVNKNQQKYVKKNIKLLLKHF